jgi:hypothetical protein
MHEAVNSQAYVRPRKRKKKKKKAIKLENVSHQKEKSLLMINKFTFSSAMVGMESKAMC